jgi:hypothetical protein
VLYTYPDALPPPLIGNRHDSSPAPRAVHRQRFYPYTLRYNISHGPRGHRALCVKNKHDVVGKTLQRLSKRDLNVCARLVGADQVRTDYLHGNNCFRFVRFHFWITLFAVCRYTRAWRLFTRPILICLTNICPEIDEKIVLVARAQSLRLSAENVCFPLRIHRIRFTYCFSSHTRTCCVGRGNTDRIKKKNRNNLISVLKKHIHIIYL